MGYPPREFVEEWARRHPWQAAAHLAAFGAIVALTVWMLAAGP